MTRRRPGRTAAAALAVPLALALSGCGTGFDAATNRPYVPSNGSSLRVGPVDVRNLLLVADETRPGTFEIIGVLVNNGPEPETLTAISVEGAGPVALTPITVPGRGLITTGSEARSTIIAADATFPVGSFTTVTLTFGDEGSGSVDVLSLTRTGVTAGG